MDIYNEMMNIDKAISYMEGERDYIVEPQELIDAFDKAIEALNKQYMIEPNIKKTDSHSLYGDIYSCPKCKRRLKNVSNDKYCPRCGQRIKGWNE